ncbi:MAG: choice-of-anchor R domain-containing protein [Thermoplasmata archaeon]
MGHPSRVAFALVLFLLLGSLVSVSPAKAHPYHLQVQNDLATFPEEVNRDQWIAQSFLAESRYNLTRVSLLLTDIGIDDELEVAIRDDAGGMPGFFNLTRATANGPSIGNWVDVDLDPWIELTAGTSYWIVAHSKQSWGDGYAWWGSDDEFAYLPGFGAASFDGFSLWAFIGHDMTFRVYGFHQPDVAFTVTPSATSLNPGETVTYQVEFQNTGLGSSAALWINLTLPPELRYVSDDAGAIGGVRSGSYSFEFKNVGSGTYIFNITARAEGGTPDGTQALTPFRLEALDHLGAPLTSSNQDVLVTILNADMAYDASVTPGTAAPSEIVEFQLTFTNAGQANAAGVWVNVSLPTELSYSSDDAGAIGGTRSGSFSFEFLDVVPASYLFNVSASVNGGIPDGTTATTNVTFESRDLAGVALNQTARDLDVIIRNAGLSLTLVSSALTAQPGDAIVLNATVRNLGGESAMNVRVDASVDANATYLTSTPPGTYNPVDRDVDWDLGTLGAGAITSVEWELSVPIGTPDGAFVRSFVRARGEDLSGTELPRQEEQSVTRIQAPGVIPALVVNRTDAEGGDEILALFYYNNTGSVTMPRAWINATLGGHYELMGLNPVIPYTNSSTGFSVELDNVTVGPHLLQARLLVVRGLDDGLAMEVQIEWTATDASDNVLAPDTLNGTVELRAPAVTMTLESSAAEVVDGSSFLLNLTVENVGQADAFGWLNLTLPAGTGYEGEASALNVTVTGGLVSWALAGMPGATNLTLQVTLRAGGDPGLKSFRFQIDLTDRMGSGPLPLLGEAVSVEFVASPSPLGNLPWLLLLVLPLVGLGAWAAVAIRRRGGKDDTSVEEVFVVDRGGSLLAHRSNSILQYKDEDLVVAMLTAIQRYIEDVFSYGVGDTIRGLEFGERRILIEDGTSHFVAIVYRGGDASGRLRVRAQSLCARIDRQFGKIIDDWNGDTDEVRGIAALLPHIWRKRATKGSE